MSKKNLHIKLTFNQLRLLHILRAGISRILMVVVIFAMAITMFLQYPFVQTRLAQNLTEWLSNKTGHDVTIETVNINWFDIVQLKGVEIKDSTGYSMVKINELLIDFRIKNIYQGGDIHLDEVTLKNGEFNLVKREVLNFDGFVQAVAQLAKKKDPNRRRPVFYIDRAHLRGMKFSFEKAGGEFFEDGRFDYNHFGFDNINGYLENFRVTKDTLELDAHRLSGREHRTLMPVKQLRAKFQFTKRRMIFDDLHAEIGESVLGDSLVMAYESPQDFSYFNDQVEILAELDSSIITTKDLAYFNPSMKQFKDVYRLTGSFRGKVSNFRVFNMEAHFGSSSHLMGRVVFRGLPEFSESLMNLRFYEAETNPADLKQYFPENHFQVLQKFGDMRFSANFFGFYNDFVTDGQFRTELGYVETDVNLKVPTNYYRGTLLTKDFDLGTLIDQPNLVQKVDMSGRVEGNGLSLANAKFDLTGKIDRLGILNYNYQNIVTDGHFEKELFNGDLAIADPNFQMEIHGEVNFANETFNFLAQIDTAQFKEMNLTRDSLMVHTRIDARFKGMDWETFSGRLGLYDSRITYRNKKLEVDSLDFATNKFLDEAYREILIDSDILDLKGRGTFDARLIYRDFLQYMEGFSNDIRLSKLSEEIEEIKKKEEEKLEKEKGQNPTYDEYTFQFEADLKDVNGVLNLLSDSFFIAPNSYLSADVAFGENTQMLYRFNSDSIFYQNNYFLKDSLIVFFSRTETETDPTFDFEARLTSDQQSLNGFETENFRVSSRRLENRILVDAIVQHANSDDMAELKGNLSFYDENFEINLVNSKFLLLNKPWITAGINKIIVEGKKVTFNDVGFASGEQRLSLDGTISSDTTKMLQVDIKDFDLNNLSAYLKKDLKGKANINAKVADIYESLRIESDIQIDSIVAEGYDIGNLTAHSQWEDKTNYLLVDAELQRDDFDLISLKGYYAPQAPQEKRMAMTAFLNAAPLSIIGPFLTGLISDIEGVAIGMLDIKGSPTTPLVKGTLFIEDGQIKVDYLNTVYRFSDKLKFSSDSLLLQKFRMLDEGKNSAYLNGSIFQDNTDKFVFNIRADINDFQVLNTPETRNALYYGTAYGTGYVNFFGHPNDLEITVQAKTDKGTRIFIPLEGSEDVVEQNYITFVSELDSTESGEIKTPEVDFSGLALNFNLEITPDAYTEIIFDKKSGDIIRGNGKGKLRMEIDTKGEFKMYGDVEIVRGAYNFTLLNIVDKRFEILPNSHITWTGDPYGANLDITATYTQMSSLTPLIDLDSIPSQSELRRRYPVRVLLGLQGDLLAPNIDFDIDVMNYPSMVMVGGAPISLESYVADFEQRIKNDEQELNRQVFSLIVLKRISPRTTFSGISESAGGSVSELLANQLSYWVSQVDDNLEIDVDLNGLNAEALNTFQLRLSYNFLDGRLRFTRAGSFTNQQNETDLTSVFGDITIEYLLTPDGQLRLKMYHKSNVNAFNTGLENNSVAGMSLMHTASFDHILPWKSKKKKLEEKPNDPANKEEEDKEETVLRPEGD